MTSLQTRLYAARSVQAARAQEEFARELRPAGSIPAQRTAEEPQAPERALADVRRLPTR